MYGLVNKAIQNMTHRLVYAARLVLEMSPQEIPKRQGLSPMLLGLVKGLGTRFNTEVETAQTQNRDQGFDYDEFSIRYKKR
jgi:hypothetical protein